MAVLCNRMTIWTGWVLALLVAAPVLAAPQAELIPFWDQHQPTGDRQVDHDVWDRFLKRYVVTDHPGGVNRVRYQAVSGEDKQRLNAYIDSLSRTKVRTLNRSEQLAYWINMYNALTVKVILDHYPVDSIRDINISPGWFSRGPWQARLVEVEGRKLSLDHIEHGILRPIWGDPRIHYAVNCASLGCPNLQPQAFTAANTDTLLNRGAKAYVNHPRGAAIDDGELTVSSIYVWFKADFGGSDQGVIAHLRRYADAALARRLKSIESIEDHDYDWRLNDMPQ